MPRLDGSVAFAWTNALLGLAFTLGVMVDIWAHSSVRPLFETFFTGWHALLYGGFAVMAGFLGASAGRARAAGAPLSGVLPAGYLLSGIGVLVFASGGAFVGTVVLAAGAGVLLATLALSERPPATLSA